MTPSLRRVTENWKLKTLAFALAVLLWIVVSAEEVTTNWIWVPLQVEVSDPEYDELAQGAPRDVQVLVSGSGRDLLDLAVRRPPLVLTIRDVADETDSFLLDPRMVQLPGALGVNAVDVRPSAVQLQFTRMETRTIPVRVRLSEPPGEDWAILEPVVAEPARITVRGPAERLEDLTYIETEQFDVEAADAAFSEVVALDTTQFRGLDLSESEVRVVGEVDRVVERIIPSVAVDVGSGIDIVPEEVEVVLRGPETFVGRTPPDFRVVVSIEEIPARIPPEGIPVPLRVDGLRGGIQATLQPAQVQLFPAPAEANVVGGSLVIPPSASP